MQWTEEWMQVSTYKNYFFYMYNTAFFIDLIYIWQCWLGFPSMHRLHFSVTRGLCPGRDHTCVPSLAGGFLSTVPPGKSASGNFEEAWFQRGLKRETLPGVPLGQGSYVLLF